jgi:hypothetical protein
MREHEAGRPRTPKRWHPWIKRISNVAAHISAASLLATGMASSLAARKPNSRQDDRGASDQAHRDRHGGNDRNQEDKHANDLRGDRRLQREDGDRSHRAGDGGHDHHGGKHEPQGDESSGVHSAAQKTQTPTPTPTTTPTPTSGGGGGGGGNHGGGGGNQGGGGGNHGGNNAGNAGSGFFDSPLATKARRRAHHFDNAGHDHVQDGTVVDVHPDGESVYQTNSVTYTTGPDGLEIHTGNITYSAEATPTPEPLPSLELPEHGPGFPFGEDFPFGTAKTGTAPAASEPTDPGDTGTAVTTRAKPIFDSSASEPGNSDGGDNTMDFSS